ncbi:MAG: hypothetical protein ACYCWN_07295 [Ferrimicrobium sp.]|jgi:hypothetical protein|uniref:Acyl-CoA carboxylase epsilon subunit n=1 Tax=Ferrimicrobium acidiphilum TaxID=121039 RepID=A0ABV3Y1S4_9ACTN|nr:hypothetical protein [Ferrimicrobium sp.]
MSELTNEEEIAIVIAATTALISARRTQVVPTVVQDSTRWRFQNRWWAAGPLGARARR